MGDRTPKKLMYSQSNIIGMLLYVGILILIIAFFVGEPFVDSVNKFVPSFSTLVFGVFF